MSQDSYAHWRPLLLEQVSLETLCSPAYRRFIHEAAIVPGCRLLLARSRRQPDWPYVETKFNPNTGRDLPPEKYALVHTWFLGRGSEALDDHLRRLDRIEGFADGERDAVRELFTRLVANMTRAILTLAERHHGRIPFRANRELAAVDAQGRPAAIDASEVSAADIFAVKGLLASRDPAVQRRALELLQRAAALIRMDRYVVEQVAADRSRRGHGMRMLMQGVGSCFSRKALEPASRDTALEIAAGMLGEALDGHYDPQTAVFSEDVDRTTGERGALLDPGHANELAGLGLGMIACLAQSSLAIRHAALIARARRDLPRLLLKSTALGYNARHPGLYKSVDNRTGEPIDTGMPWWNLPETMRAAVYALAVVETDAQRAQLLEIFRLSHNAYFANYPNRAMMLFPFQTLDGATGKVVDIVPAVPEGDPLYHANGAFLDMLDALAKL